MSSRRSFLLGAGFGAGALYLGGAGMRHAFNIKDRPPWVTEHAVDSFWLEGAGFYDYPPRPPLNHRHHTTDILIIGGGFTGLSTAWHLLQTRPEARITLIDAARCGFGASGRNGGWCMGANYLAFFSAPQLSRAAHDFMSAGVEIVRGLDQEEGIPCDFTPAHQLRVVRERDDLPLVDRTAEAIAELGLGVERLDAEALTRRYHTEHFVGGAIFADGSANIQPVKLALGLRNRLLESPVEIFEGTKVMSIDYGARPTVQTEFGTIEAGEIVLATNAYTHSYGAFKNRYAPVISHVIATEPLRASQRAAIGFSEGEQLNVGDSGEGFFYAIMTADHRIVIGGDRGPTHHYGSKLHSGNLRSRTDYLEDYLTRRIWPQLEGTRITHRWGGNICVTRDLLFSLGRTKEHDRVYYALGYTGEGVSTSFAAGKALAELMAGLDTELTRSPFIDRPLGLIPQDPLRSPLIRLLS